MPPTIHLRHATPSDIPVLATMTAEAMANDETILYQWPSYQSQPPSVVTRWWTHTWRRMLSTRDEWYMVAEVDTDWSFPGTTTTTTTITTDAPVDDKFKGPGTPGSREIVGLCGWKRVVGASEDAAVQRAWQKNCGAWAAFERHLQSWDQWYARLTGIDTGLDHSVRDLRNAARAKAVVPDVPQIPGGPVVESTKRPHVELVSLLVSVRFQRQGIASQLVGWGQACAQREGVPVMVRSTNVGVAVYERCGFEQIGTMRYVVDEEEEEEAGPPTVYLAWVPW